jgi:hypothetical protein
MCSSFVPSARSSSGAQPSGTCAQPSRPAGSVANIGSIGGDVVVGGVAVDVDEVDVVDDD